MPFAEQLAALKEIDVQNLEVSLAIVNEYKILGQSRYPIRYVQTTANLRSRLSAMLSDQLGQVQNTREYTFDCPDADQDEFLAIGIEETDFLAIRNAVEPGLPAENYIQGKEELFNAKAYMVIYRNDGDLRLITYTLIPENWKMRQQKRLLSITWNNEAFDQLDNQDVFSIAQNVDLICFGAAIFMASKKRFEQALNFRERVIAEANNFYQEAAQLGLFTNGELLNVRVGRNQRYLRKINMIQTLGHYKNPDFLGQLKIISEDQGWNIQFDGTQIILQEDNIDEVLLLLQHKRLNSPITNRFYDIEGTTTQYVGNQ